MDRKDFAETYPFIPYQFRLLQNVFTDIRKHGFAGKHLSSGERSLIGAFQGTAKRYSNYTVEKEAKKALYAIQSYNKITDYEFLALKQTILVDKLSKLYNKELDYLNVKDGKLNINDIEFDDFVLANSKYITKVDNLEVTNNVQDIYMNYTSSILEVYLGVKTH